MEGPSTAFNLTRDAGAPASAFHARATRPTTRTRLSGHFAAYSTVGSCGYIHPVWSMLRPVRLDQPSGGATKAPGGRGLVTVRAIQRVLRTRRHRRGTPRGARFSITARMNRTVVKAIAGIKESARTPINYPEGDLGRRRTTPGL